jgi:hypothetical protein
MMRRTALIASAVTAILLWLSPIAQAQTSDEPAQSAVPDFSAVDGHSLAAAPATEAAAPANGRRQEGVAETQA